MCGINGIITTDNRDLNKIKNDIRIMNNSIIHRGPDDDGEFIISNENYSVALGMRRLSIIDINAGSQPIISENTKIVIVFNGEIYNYKELRNNLVEKGVFFSTNSDTEVILKLYQFYGPSSFSMLDGMFAFSIYDKAINKIFIARDFFGEKPLYYTKTNNSILWSSELKSIKLVINDNPKISVDALSLFLQLTYIPAPYTIYENIFKLEPDNYIEINCIENIFEIKKINKNKYNFQFNSKNEAIAITRELVFESVASRSISDVPIGTFLSGGVDSSIVSFCLSKYLNRKIDTFSIGFEKKSFDELPKARIVSKLINSNHHEFTIKESDLTNNIDEIILNFDEPFADSSALASYLVSNKTKDYVKVALTGDGGDEVFGGYNKYYMGSLNKIYTDLFPPYFHKYNLKLSKLFNNLKNDNRGLKFKIDRFLRSVDYNDNFYLNILKLGFQENEVKKILNLNYIYNNDLLKKDKTISNFNTINDFRLIDKLISLEGDLLVKVDRTSMLSSLECRAPFLNKKLWDFSLQLPDNYLINRFEKKHLLKKAFEKDFPSKFLEISKKGFGVPVGDWLRNTLKIELLSYIEREFIIRQNIFNLKEIQDLVNLHISGEKDNSFKVWTFFCFQKWYVNIYEKKAN